MLNSIKILLATLIGLSISACATDVSIQNTTTSPQSFSKTLPLTSPSLPAPNDKTMLTAQQLDFPAWRQQLNREALSKGISQSTLDAASPYLKINTKILVFDQQQAEFTQTFWTYLGKRLNELRVQAGRLQAFSHDELLKKIEQEQGVPPEILVSFWGLETNYGTYLGDFSTLEALTTLAYDPRRSDFFRKELLAALNIIDRGDISASEMRGSWAGAIGQMQFMPSVYLKHATDADNDHRADLLHSTSDALTSAAVYLRAAGWSAKQPWLQQVTLPTTFDYALADGKTEIPLEQAQALGIKPMSGSWLPSDTNTITLVLPAGFEGPAFATWANFKVIKRWNHSNNYALSVGLLAHRIANKGQPILTIPSNEKPWSRTFITQLQQTLTQAGYDTGGADGWFGSRSIQALRNFQQAHQLPADGYPNRKTLALLNLTP